MSIYIYKTNYSFGGSMITKDDLAVFIFEQCQDRTAKLSAIVTAVAQKANVSEDSIEDIIRRYKHSGSGLEKTAQEILGDQPLITHNEAILTNRQSDTIEVITPQIVKPNFTIHNGQVVTLAQEKADFQVIDGTIPEIASIPVSVAYFENRVKELFKGSSYDIKNLAKRFNKEGKTLDLAKVKMVDATEGQDYRRAELYYDNVLYSGWKMQTKDEQELEAEKDWLDREGKETIRKQQAGERDAKIKSLGLNKFDDPDLAYEVYVVLSAKDDFTFDLNLLSEEDEGGCTVYTYDDTEYAVWSEDTLNENYYNEQVEYVRDNPHDYADCCCDGADMADIVGCSEGTGYDSEFEEGVTGSYIIVTR